MDSFWDAVFKLGCRLEKLSRWMIRRANSQSWRMAKGLGFPDKEARQIAHEVVTSEVRYSGSPNFSYELRRHR